MKYYAITSNTVKFYIPILYNFECVVMKIEKFIKRHGFFLFWLLADFLF